jgi:hypothetical protein
MMVLGIVLLEAKLDIHAYMPTRLPLGGLCLLHEESPPIVIIVVNVH